VVLHFGKRSFNNKRTPFPFCLVALIGFGNNVVGELRLHFSHPLSDGNPPPGENAARVSPFFSRRTTAIITTHLRIQIKCRARERSFANDGVIYIAVAPCASSISAP
jgi:hypothetical protein